MTTSLPASFLPERFRVLSGSALKLIAIILMLIDHTGVMILYNYPPANAILFSFGGVDYSWYRIFRDIGRAAFPIFCFLLVEGFLHTHNRRKYGRNLFLFACISEIPWNFMFTNTWRYEKQNVFLPCFWDIWPSAPLNTSGIIRRCSLYAYWHYSLSPFFLRQITDGGGLFSCLSCTGFAMKNCPGYHRKLLALL